MYLTGKYGWLCDACMDKVREGKDAEIQRVCGKDIHSSDGEA